MEEKYQVVITGGKYSKKTYAVGDGEDYLSKWMTKKDAKELAKQLNKDDSNKEQYLRKV